MGPGGRFASPGWFSGEFSTAGELTLGCAGASPLGRQTRLFTAAQQRALRLRDKRCRAEGCTIAASWTEAHHLDQWASGGRTDLDNGVLFCSWHHDRAHDDSYRMCRLPNGDYRFHRRT